MRKRALNVALRQLLLDVAVVLGRGLHRRAARGRAAHDAHAWWPSAGVTLFYPGEYDLKQFKVVVDSGVGWSKPEVWGAEFVGARWRRAARPS